MDVLRAALGVILIRMKIALAQINPTVGDFSGNLAKILSFALRAAEAGASLCCFPELAVCGYPPADFLEKDAFVARAEAVIEELCAWTSQAGSPAILCGSVARAEASEGKRVRNVAVLMQGGSMTLVQPKMLLPFYDVFDEQRYFEPGESQVLVEVAGQTLAITICEDAWNDKGFWPQRFYPLDPVEQLMARWADASPRVILNISASPFWQGKRQVREEMLAALARRHGATVAMVNQVGGNDSLIFDGTSLVAGPDGAVVARGRSFAEDLIVFDTAATANPSSGDESSDTAATWEALVLGTRDYVRKCGFRKALVGLSGGIDSALVAAIAVEALGAENVMGVGMPSEFSSAGSKHDARVLADHLGIRLEMLPVQPVFEQYQATLRPLFAGTPFGLAEENLQSRIRGALLMAISNKFGRVGADDRQQERDGDGILHALRRHGGRAGGDWRCGEDAGLPTGGVRQPSSRGDSTLDDHEAAVGGVATGAEGYGLAATL